MSARVGVAMYSLEKAKTKTRPALGAARAPPGARARWGGPLARAKCMFGADNGLSRAGRRPCGGPAGFGTRAHGGRPAGGLGWVGLGCVGARSSGGWSFGRKAPASKH
jgi:hypothetical protein